MPEEKVLFAREDDMPVAEDLSNEIQTTKYLISSRPNSSLARIIG